MNLHSEISNHNRINFKLVPPSMSELRRTWRKVVHTGDTKTEGYVVVKQHGRRTMTQAFKAIDNLVKTQPDTWSWNGDDLLGTVSKIESEQLGDFDADRDMTKPRKLYFFSVTRKKTLNHERLTRSSSRIRLLVLAERRHVFEGQYQSFGATAAYVAQGRAQWRVLGRRLRQSHNMVRRERYIGFSSHQKSR